MSRSVSPGPAPSPPARRALAAVAAVGLAVAAAGGVLVATSGHLVDPVAYAIEVSVLVAGTVLVALHWLVARPGNRIGIVLLAYAACLAGVSLQGASTPALHSVGVLFDAPSFLLGYYLVFIVPSGRLVGALEKALMAGTAWVVLASFLPWFFFSPFVSGAAPLAGCNASCPRNALMITDAPGIASGFGRTEEILEAVIAAAIVLGMGYRTATSSAPRRRALLPVYVPALLLTVPFGIFHADNAGLISLGSGTRDRLGWFVTAGRISLSFGFLLAILLAMLFAGVALKAILSRLGRDQDSGRLRDLVSDALDDPSLELAFGVDGSGVLVDSLGEPIDLAARDRRSVTALDRRGEAVAYILHDPALDTDPELVTAAGQAVLLALESGRLESELRSRIDELRISRGRIVAASEAERRKIERDLHDGAQQRLMAIQVKLAMAQERAQDEHLVQDLEAIRADASGAVDELRALAHGIYPAVLLERGITDALRSVAMTTPIGIDLRDEGIGRCPPAVEASVYFCTVEAIQNAIKHAGRGARVTITLARAPGSIDFAIADDGVGIPDGTPVGGMGVVSMQDRIGALGGRLEVTSGPGRGTCVRGSIPDDAAQAALEPSPAAP